MKRKAHRTLEQIEKDCLWPQLGFIADPDENFRLRAVFEVLRSLPAKSYRALSGAIDEFVWFIPDERQLGMVMPFCITREEEPAVPPSELGEAAYSRVLYLSPVLERMEFPLVVAVVAHEIAHIVLDHELRVPDEKCGKQEDEACSLVRKWGFKVEADVHKAWSKYRSMASRA